MLATIAGFLFLLLAVPIAACDLTTRRVPDLFTVGGALLIFGARVFAAAQQREFHTPASLGGALFTRLEFAAPILAGPILAAGFLYAVWYVTRGGIGRGDAKYALHVGLVVPGVHAVAALLCACLAALLSYGAYTVFASLRAAPARRHWHALKRVGCRIPKHAPKHVPVPTDVSLPFAPFLAVGAVAADTLLRVRGWE